MAASNMQQRDSTEEKEKEEESSGEQGGVGQRVLNLLRGPRDEERLAGLLLLRRLLSALDDVSSRWHRGEGSSAHPPGTTRNEGDLGDGLRDEAKLKDDGDGSLADGNEQSRSDSVEEVKSLLLLQSYRAIGLKFIMRLMMPLKGPGVESITHQRLSKEAGERESSTASEMHNILSSGCSLAFTMLAVFASEKAIQFEMAHQLLSSSKSESTFVEMAGARGGDVTGETMTIIEVVSLVNRKTRQMVALISEYESQSAMRSLFEENDEDSKMSFFMMLLDALEFLNRILIPVSYDTADDAYAREFNEENSLHFMRDEIVKTLLADDFLSINLIIYRDISRLLPVVISSGGIDLKGKLQSQCLLLVDNLVRSSYLKRHPENGTSTVKCDTITRVLSQMLQITMIGIGSEYAEIQLESLPVLSNVVFQAQRHSIGAPTGFDQAGTADSKVPPGDTVDILLNRKISSWSSRISPCVLFRKGLRRFLTAKLDERRRHLLIKLISCLIDMENGEEVLFGKGNPSLGESNIEVRHFSSDDEDFEWKEILKKEQQMNEERDEMSREVADELSGSNRKSKTKHGREKNFRKESTVTTRYKDGKQNVNRYKESRLPIFCLLSHHLKVESQVLLHDAARNLNGDRNGECGNDRNVGNRQIVAMDVLPSVLNLCEKMIGILANLQQDTTSTLTAQLDVPEDKFVEVFNSFKSIVDTIIEYCYEVISIKDSSQDLLVMACIRPMSRFISEVPEAFITVNESPSKQLLSIMPYCMATGYGQGATYMLPALLQLSRFMSERDIQDDDNMDDQHVIFVFQTLKYAIEFGVLKAVSFSYEILETHFTVQASHEDNHSKFLEELKEQRRLLLAWSDVIVDLSWSCKEDREGVGIFMASTMQEMGLFLDKIRKIEGGDVHTIRGRKAARVLRADIEETAIMLQSLSHLY